MHVAGELLVIFALSLVASSCSRLNSIDPLNTTPSENDAAPVLLFSDLTNGPAAGNTAISLRQIAGAHGDRFCASTQFVCH